MAKDDDIIDTGRLGDIRKRLGKSLPDGWVMTTLGDAFKWGSGGTPKRTDARFYGGNIPWLIIGDLNDGVVTESETTITEDGLKESSAKWVEPGSVLLAMYGSIGKLGIAGRRLTTNQAIAFTKPDPVDAKYLYYYLMYTRGDLASLGKGATQKNISQTVIKAFPFVLAPQDQQKYIVAEIEKQFSRLDEAVANLKRVKANLKRYKAAVLKAAVEGHLVETEAELARREGRNYETGAQLLQRILETRRSQWKGKGKYKEPAAPDTTDLPELPEGWVWAIVLQVAEVASGNTPTGILGTVKQVGDVPWFKVGDMNHEENQQVMRHADAWLSHAEVRSLGLRLFQPNTVLFPKRGGAIATNKKRRLESAGCSDLNIMGITPDGEIAPYFFSWFDGINLAGLSDGSNVPQINHKDIEPLVIPLPPLAEQHRIVADVDRRLSLVREVEIQVDANFRRAGRLKEAIMAKAFTGHLLITKTPTQPLELEQKGVA